MAKDEERQVMVPTSGVKDPTLAIFIATIPGAEAVARLLPPGSYLIKIGA